MVERIVVKNCLSDLLIRAGQELLRSLSEGGLDTYSAAWFFSSENEDWRLLVALKNLDGSGRRGAYDAIYHLLKKNPDIESTIGFYDVFVILDSDPLAQAFAKVGKGLQDGPGRTYAGPVKNGPYVEDAFVYRLP